MVARRVYGRAAHKAFFSPQLDYEEYKGSFFAPNLERRRDFINLTLPTKNSTVVHQRLEVTFLLFSVLTYH